MDLWGLVRMPRGPGKTQISQILYVWLYGPYHGGGRNRLKPNVIVHFHFSLNFFFLLARQPGL